MKKSLLVFTYLILLGSIFGQPCYHPNSYYEEVIGPYVFATKEIFPGILYKSTSSDRLDVKDDIYLSFNSQPWVFAQDSKGKTYFAGAHYHNSFDNSDFYPGPLDDNGEAYLDQCDFWNRIFVVDKRDMTLARSLLYDANGDLLPGIDCAKIPPSIMDWPAKGNINLSPFTPQHQTADFFDFDQDGIYNPCRGDLPMLTHEQKLPSTVTEVLASFPQKLLFQISNDVAGAHKYSSGDPLHIEVHHYMWSPINSDGEAVPLLRRYNIINRGPHNFTKFGFAYWADNEIGCAFDDFVGTIPERHMAFNYNADAVDGNHGPDCGGGLNTFAGSPPIFGTTYLDGVDIVDSNGTKIDQGNTATLFSFNFSVDSTMIDLVLDDNKIAKILLDLNITGGPVIYNGDTITYMHVGNPADTSANTLCKLNVQGVDARMVFSSLGASLSQGQQQDVTIAHWLTFKANHPCPDITPLLDEHDKLLGYYNNQYVPQTTLDPPLLEYQRNTGSITVKISNLPLSNNINETFAAPDINAPSTGDPYLYKFEGYKVYQIFHPDVAIHELDIPELAELVYQTDISNGIDSIINYEAQYDDADKTFIPVVKVVGADKGIELAFDLDYDYLGKQPIRRDGEYYYVAVAYAYNNYIDFDPVSETGQQRPYLQSQVLVPLVVSPTLDDEALAPQITRIHGMGNNNDVVLSEGSRRRIMEENFDGRITYAINKGPFDVVVMDSAKITSSSKFRVVIDGPFNENRRICSFEDQSTSVVLTNLNTGEEYRSTNSLLDEEFVFDDLGIIIYLTNNHISGKDNRRSNGFINQSYKYQDPSAVEWLGTIGAKDTEVKDIIEIDLDPSEPLENIEDRYGVFSSSLQSIALPTIATKSNPNLHITPTADNGNLFRLARHSSEIKLEDLNNVDIVFTKDKALWSRCIVVETANNLYSPYIISGSVEDMMHIKTNPSVDKSGIEDGTGTGMSWFPGYAIDIETGTRLNIFFGENTVFSKSASPWSDKDVTDDMWFNPTSDIYLTNEPDLEPIMKAVMGGQHYIYITRQKYDECASLREAFSNLTIDFLTLRAITWTMIPYLNNGATWIPIADGFIPNDVVVSLRVNNGFSYQLDQSDLAQAQCIIQGQLPTYEFFMDKNPGFVGGASTVNRSVPWSVVLDINHCKIHDLKEDVKVTVSDLNGNIWLQWELKVGEELILDTSNLPKGNHIGIVNVRSKSGYMTKSYKVVVIN